MPTILDTRDSTFDAEFEAFLNRSRESDDAVSETVTSIIDDVRRNGDQALIDLTRRLDDLELTPSTLAFSADEIDAAAEQVSPEERDAIRFAFDRIMAFHQRQLPQDQRWTDEAGAEIGWKWTPIRRVGVYGPRRNSILSVIGVDERRSGTGCRRRRNRDGGTNTRWQGESTGSLCGTALLDQVDLQDWRRAGHRGPCLRNGND